MKILTSIPSSFLPKTAYFVGVPKHVPLLDKLNTKRIFYDDYNLIENEIIKFKREGLLHGVSHALKVLYLSLKIGEYYYQTDDELKILAFSSIFHDTCRENDGDDLNHGKRAMEYYIQKCNEGFIDYYPEAAFIIGCHNLEDKEGYAHLQTFDEIKDKQRAKLFI